MVSRATSYNRPSMSAHPATVKQASLFRTPSAFCRSRASRPRKGVSDFSLHVKASPLSRGVSSDRTSACQCR